MYKSFWPLGNQVGHETKSTWKSRVMADDISLLLWNVWHKWKDQQTYAYEQPKQHNDADNSIP